MLIRALFLIVGLCLAGPVTAQDVPDDLVAQMPENPTGRLAHILARGRLIVGVKSDYPPWGMIDETGDLVGLEPDLARDLADRMGVDLELRSVTAANRIGRVNQGLVDVVIATTGDTAERRLQADLLQPNYYSSGVVLYGRADLNLNTWDALAGQPICLSRGSYYNRTLEETYGIDGQYFTGSRESRLALLHGRCVGWAFDDTALAQQIRNDPSDDFKIMEETILVTPWAVIVAKGEGKADLGNFVSDMIGEWHAAGRILALQDKWTIPRTAYVEDKHEVWSQVESGRALCARDPQTGARPTVCLDPPPLRSAPAPVPPDWMVSLRDATGVDLTALSSDYNRGRLLRGLGLTLGLSAVAVAGSLVVGIVFALLQVRLARFGLLGQVLLLPQRLLVTVARMTPPILQLYIVFFGLGGAVLKAGSWTPGGFAIAGLILSLYAGATNSVILGHALVREGEAHPGTRLLALLPGAIARGFDGLVATCVNIVKAAGMASAIAVGELISTINLIVSEGGDTSTMMTGLLVFYFLFVLAILWLFKSAKRALVRS